MQFRNSIISYHINFYYPAACLCAIFIHTLLSFIFTETKIIFETVFKEIFL